MSMQLVSHPLISKHVPRKRNWTLMGDGAMPLSSSSSSSSTSAHPPSTTTSNRIILSPKQSSSSAFVPIRCSPQQFEDRNIDNDDDNINNKNNDDELSPPRIVKSVLRNAHPRPIPIKKSSSRPSNISSNPPSFYHDHDHDRGDYYYYSSDNRGGDRCCDTEPDFSPSNTTSTSSCTSPPVNHLQSIRPLLRTNGNVSPRSVMAKPWSQDEDEDDHSHQQQQLKARSRKKERRIVPNQHRNQSVKETGNEDEDDSHSATKPTGDEVWYTNWLWGIQFLFVLHASILMGVFVLWGDDPAQALWMVQFLGAACTSAFVGTFLASQHQRVVASLAWWLYGWSSTLVLLLDVVVTMVVKQQTLYWGDSDAHQLEPPQQLTNYGHDDEGKEEDTLIALAVYTMTSCLLACFLATPCLLGTVPSPLNHNMGTLSWTVVGLALFIHGFGLQLQAQIFHFSEKHCNGTCSFIALPFVWLDDNDEKINVWEMIYHGDCFLWLGFYVTQLPHLRSLGTHTQNNSSIVTVQHRVLPYGVATLATVLAMGCRTWAHYYQHPQEVQMTEEDYVNVWKWMLPLIQAAFMYHPVWNLAARKAFFPWEL